MLSLCSYDRNVLMLCENGRAALAASTNRRNVGGGAADARCQPRACASPWTHIGLACGLGAPGRCLSPPASRKRCCHLTIVSKEGGGKGGGLWAAHGLWDSTRFLRPSLLAPTTSPALTPFFHTC